MSKKKKGYTVSSWKGITKYNCDYCAFDSLNENVIKDHIQKVHAEPKKPEPVKIPLKDRFGNPVVDSKGEQLYKTSR